MKLLNTLLFTLLTASISFAGNPELTLNLESGKTYNVSSTMNMTYFKDASLSEEVMKMELDMKAAYKVLSKTSDGVHTVEVDFKSLIMKQNMGGMAVTYDSENPDPENPMTAMIEPQVKPLLENTITVMVNKYGEIIEQTGGAEGGMADMSSMIENLFISYPKEKIKVGSSWSKDMTQEEAGIKTTSTYTVKEISKSDVKLSITTDMDSSENEQLKDSETKSGGTMIIDAKTGWVKQSDMNVTMKGNNPQMGEFFMVTKVSQKTL